MACCRNASLGSYGNVNGVLLSHNEWCMAFSGLTIALRDGLTMVPPGGDNYYISPHNVLITRQWLDV